MVKITIIDTDYCKDEYYKSRVKKTDYFIGRNISCRLNSQLLRKIYNASGYNWHLIITLFKNEDYVWWSYVNYQHNCKLRRFIDIMEMEQSIDSGCPPNIISIIELINMNCYFNLRIRYFFSLMSWAHKIFIYYNRFYRYRRNNRLFGKKEHLDTKNGYKLHFVAYFYHRQFTGVKLNKNHLRF